MILSHDDLKRAWKQRQIRFSPDISESQIAESSIDLRLGYHFTKLKAQATPVRPTAEAFDKRFETETLFFVGGERTDIDYELGRDRSVSGCGFLHGHV